MTDKVTWAIAARECRALGWTVKATGCGKERVAYPKGTNADSSSSYFTSCPEDMMGTVQEMSP